MSPTNTNLLLDEYGEVIETTDWRHPDFDPTDSEMQEANHLAIAWHDGI
jgi:hypothetical protein